jgi:hypothetical protein
VIGGRAQLVQRPIARRNGLCVEGACHYLYFVDDALSQLCIDRNAIAAGGGPAFVLLASNPCAHRSSRNKIVA